MLWSLHVVFRVKYAVNTETGARVAIKILDKERIQKQNMGAQIKKEVRLTVCREERIWRSSKSRYEPS